MLKEIAYWTWWFFSQSRRRRKLGGIVGDSVMLVSVSLLGNCFALAYFIEYVFDCRILDYIPITTRWSPLTWISIAVLLSPFVYLIYHRYFLPERLAALQEEFSAKSEARQTLGRVSVFLYGLLSVVLPLLMRTWFGH